MMTQAKNFLGTIILFSSSLGLFLTPVWASGAPGLASPDSHPVQPKPGIFRKHLDQMFFYNLVKEGENDGNPNLAFEIAVEQGEKFFDNLFDTDPPFGVGSNVGQGQRFTRVPRADLKGPKEWANHFPKRSTGPNARSCIECHTVPAHDGAGFAALNVIRDPLHSGNSAMFINRKTPHLFGIGAIQLLAEEMTQDLRNILDAAKKEGCKSTTLGPTEMTPPNPISNGPVVRKRLITKGIDFGWISVFETSENRSGDSIARCVVKTTEVVGVDSNLIVRPFQWKGVVNTIRNFNRVAAYNEMGLQATELVGDGVDGDGDDVADEVSIGDMTALTVYVADQPRPVSLQELSEAGMIPSLTRSENRAIDRGKNIFNQIGCAICHTPELKLKNSVFREPSRTSFFRDTVFPGGQNPAERGVDPKAAITFDLTQEVVGNFSLGLFKKDEQGDTRVELYSDLKRHDLGPEDAESIDEVGTGNSVWKTRPLWGLGSVFNYMHDGRATQISQAVESHGGEAAASRAMYEGLSLKDRTDLEKFLLNLRLYKPDESDSRQGAAGHAAGL